MTKVHKIIMEITDKSDSTTEEVLRNVESIYDTIVADGLEENYPQYTKVNFKIKEK